MMLNDWHCIRIKFICHLNRINSPYQHLGMAAVKKIRKKTLKTCIHGCFLFFCNQKVHVFVINTNKFNFHNMQINKVT